MIIDSASTRAVQSTRRLAVFRRLIAATCVGLWLYVAVMQAGVIGLSLALVGLIVGAALPAVMAERSRPPGGGLPGFVPLPVTDHWGLEASREFPGRHLLTIDGLDDEQETAVLRSLIDAGHVEISRGGDGGRQGHD